MAEVLAKFRAALQAARVPCSCGDPAVMEKQGRTVCARCARWLKGREFPIRRGKQFTANEREKAAFSSARNVIKFKEMLYT